MQDSVQTTQARASAEGARELQAKLYREIGISAVAAALHSINQPEPGRRPADMAASSAQASARTVRAA